MDTIVDVMKEFVPLYRAKKIKKMGTSDYVIGFLVKKTYDDLKVRYFILEDNHIEIAMTWEVDPLTISIHFPSMIDNNDNKIFASLGNKGGDILSDGEYNMHLDFDGRCYRVNIDGNTSPINDWESWNKFTIFGIQE